MSVPRCAHCGHVHEHGACPRLGTSRVGAILESKYELVRVLGSGGMGEVYEARHRELSRRVAIKFLLPTRAAEPGLVARFENEARAAGALQHENIATLFDVGKTQDGARYLVMEFLEGEDCAALLARHRTLAPGHAIRLALQVCRGLTAAHDHGIVHRDLKPANLFVTKRADGTELVKILDFGIAKLLAPEGSESSTTGAVLGTPHYMSPEQALGSRELDHRTDLHALGVILYEFVAGKKPYEGTSALEILHRIATRTPEPLSKLCPDLSPAFIECVATAMARDPKARFASASDLQQRLCQVLGEVDREDGVALAPRAQLDETRPTRADTDAALGGEHFTTHVPVSPAARPERARAWQRPLRVLAGVGLLLVATSWAWTPSQRDRGAVSGARPSAIPSSSAPLGSRLAVPAAAPSGQRADRPDTPRQPVASPVFPPSGARSRLGSPATSLGPSPIPAPTAGSDSGSAPAAEAVRPEPPQSPVAPAASSQNPTPPAPAPAVEDELNRLRVDPHNPYR